MDIGNTIKELSKKANQTQHEFSTDEFNIKRNAKENCSVETVEAIMNRVLSYRKELGGYTISLFMSSTNGQWEEPCLATFHGHNIKPSKKKFRGVSFKSALLKAEAFIVDEVEKRKNFSQKENIDFIN